MATCEPDLRYLPMRIIRWIITLLLFAGVAYGLGVTLLPHFFGHAG